MIRKLLFVTLISIAYNGNAFSRCGSSGIHVWPKTKEISVNSIFVVEGYRLSEEIITGLNKKHKIYVKSGKHIVPLIVSQLNTGLYNLSQAVLKPEVPLISGLSYSLHIDSLSEYESEDFYRNNYKWLVTNKNDHVKPTWNQAPIYLGKEKQQFGCGPSDYVYFCICPRDNSPVLILSKLKELKTGKVTEYLVNPDSTLLRIGHGMCSGEFAFTDGSEYEITFSLMDASGNATDQMTEPIQFISPTDSDVLKESTFPKCDCKNSLTRNSVIFIIVSLLLILIMVEVGLLFHNKEKS